MDVADRFLLLAVAADNDGWPMNASGRPLVRPVFERAAAAALVAELALQGRVVPGDQVTVVDRSPTGDAELDAALRALPPSSRAWRCVNTVASGKPELVRLRRMRERGLLHTYPRGRTEWLFVRETTTALETVVAPLHAALRSWRCDEKTLALLGLLRATGLHSFWLNGLPAAERDLRLGELLAGYWLPDLTDPELPAIM